MNRIGNLPVDLYSAICDNNNNNNNNCCSVYPQLPPVIGAPWGYCGRGFLFPVDYDSVGVQLTRLRRLNQGTLTSICVRKNLNATVLHVSCTREFKNKILYRHKSQRKNVSIQYSSIITNILCVNILYTNSGCGKNTWTPPWTSGAIP